MRDIYQMKKNRRHNYNNQAPKKKERTPQSVEQKRGRRWEWTRPRREQNGEMQATKSKRSPGNQYSTTTQNIVYYDPVFSISYWARKRLRLSYKLSQESWNS